MTSVNRDPEGFLRDLGDWSPDVAREIGEDHGIELTPHHWRIIELIRQFYHEHGLSPPSRVLMNLITKRLDPGFNSIALMQLFGGKARRHLAQIAGLPKPSDCD